jgi:hypothetical protein
MKADQLILLLLIGAVGFVAYKRFATVPVGAATPTSLPAGGTQPTTLGQSDVSSIAAAIGAAFNFAGSIAQSQPRTT